MKKILVILLFLIAFKAQSQTPQAPIVFANPSQMSAYTGSYTLAVVISNDTAGVFYKQKDTTLTPDYDRIFPSALAGYVWVRKTNNFVSTSPPIAYITASVDGNPTRLDGQILFIQKTAMDSVTIDLQYQAGREKATPPLISIIVADSSQGFTQPEPGNTIDSILELNILANQNVSYSIVVLASDSSAAFSTINIQFVEPIYYGFSSTATFADLNVLTLNAYLTNDPDITSLTSMGSIIGNEHGWFLFPKSVNPNENQSLIINAVNQTDIFDRATETVTNSSGYVSDYTAYSQGVETASNYTFTIYINTDELVDNIPFLYGSNCPSTAIDIKRMRDSTSAFNTLESVNTNYHQQFLRYPGGTVSLNYFWYNPNPGDSLPQQTNQILYDFFIYIGDTKHAEQYAERQTSYQPDDYQKWLEFIDSVHATPIIQINNQFYRDGSNAYLLTNLVDKTGLVYNAGGLQPDRWDVARQYFTDQVNYTHSILDGIVYWEIGNECYARMSAAEYVETVVNIVGIIKSLYPQDKIICAFSKGDYQHSPVENDAWNHDVAALLTASGVLYQVDYFAPHYYHRSDTYQSNENAIVKRFSSSYFSDVYSYLINDAGFPSNYNLQLFYTEANVSRLAVGDSVTIANPGTNTQYNAMLQLSLLMSLQSKTHISGMINHTYSSLKNGTFYDSITAAGLGYIPSNYQDNSYFRYITPQGVADSLFQASTGDQPIETQSNVGSTFQVTVSKTGSTRYVQILNFTNSTHSFSLTGLGTINWTVVVLDDLTSYHWNTTANKTTGSSSGSLSLPAHSFVYFTY